MTEENQTTGKRRRGVYVLGPVAGLLNGLFGAGGGMAAVPMLRGLGLPAESCHATSIAIILPLSIASGFAYARFGSLNIADALPYLPGGALGAVVGAWLLPRIGSLWLRRVFGALVLFAAVRMLLS